MAELTAYQPASAASDASVSSSLGDVVDTTSPYSFAPTLTVGAGATVLTTITRASDASSVSVTGSTTATPTATLTAAVASVGDSFHCESVATDGSFTDTVVTTVFMEGTGGGGGGGSYVSIIDPSAVTYDFLTTGGTGGSGGEGAHTVGGESWTLSYEGGSTPDGTAFASGVLQHRGNVTNKRSYLVLDLGEDVDTTPYAIYISTSGLGASSSQSFLMRLATSATPGYADNYLGFLFGYDGAADDTSILVRECTGGTNFTTIEQVLSLTDITTTPTRFALHVTSGAALISYDQGTATLPTNGAPLGTALAKNLGLGAIAATRQNRRYLHLYCLENVDIRFKIHRMEIA